MIRAFWEDSLTITTFWGNSLPVENGRYNLPGSSKGPAFTWQPLGKTLLKVKLLVGYTLKTNMSPENPWLEDVFPTEIVPF